MSTKPIRLTFMINAFVHREQTYRVVTFQTKQNGSQKNKTKHNEKNNERKKKIDENMFISQNMSKEDEIKKPHREIEVYICRVRKTHHYANSHFFLLGSPSWSRSSNRFYMISKYIHKHRLTEGDTMNDGFVCV